MSKKAFNIKLCIDQLSTKVSSSKPNIIYTNKGRDYEHNSKDTEAISIAGELELELKSGHVSAKLICKA